jgi:glycosyltransferase involved in cell wall biosynthesis
MSLAQKFVALGKRVVRRYVGVWPAMEWRNRAAMGHAAPGLKRFEDREVARLAATLARIPTAMVACIMPTYRRPDQLLEAVASVLSQDYRDLVLVVVDDGAGLPELPRDDRVFAVSLSRNSKVLGLVRNVGIRLSQSKYIAFLDDDNTWTPDHLSVALGALESGLDLVYTAVRRRTPDGAELDVLSRPFGRKTFANDPNYVDANSVVLRRTERALFSRLPRVRQTMPKEDWEFVFRQSRGARVAHIPTPTVEYLVNSDSYYTNWKKIADQATS